MDGSRRNFLRRYWLDQTADIVAGFQKGIQAARERQAFDEYFASYESCNSLTLAYPDEILIETARNAGIKVDGREKIDIVKELFAKTRGY